MLRAQQRSRHCALGVVATVLFGPVRVLSGTDAVGVWQSNPDGALTLAKRESLSLVAATTSPVPTIRLNSARRFQSMIGFGASLTDASAHILLHRMSVAQRDALLDDLFGVQGIHFGILRLTIGSCDLWASEYSYDDVPKGQTDPSLSHFSLARAESDIVPLVRMALARNPDLKLIATPWSAPGWMKSSGSMLGGTLKNENYNVYSAYLTRYLQEMRAAGIKIDYLTVQNEPNFTPPDYPGMVMTAAMRTRFVTQYLAPKLRQAALDTKILDNDHNWNAGSWSTDLLGNENVRDVVRGVAWHCYGGNVSEQSRIHAAFPDKDTLITECTARLTDEWSGTLGWDMTNLLIGGTRNWARAVMMWNLVLDERGGPHLGACKNCRGVITVDSRTGDATREPEYFTFSHLSHFLQSGAQRIASNSLDHLIDVAFQNPDGTFVLLVYNDSAEPKQFRVLETQREFSYKLPAKSAATFLW